MGTRLQLQTLLEEITEHVYFQPPGEFEMQYPCIRYTRDDSFSEYAGDKLYTHIKRYQVTVIDRNPDSALPDTVENLPFCAFDRHFSAEGLNHWVFNLYF